jgi:hypothetical protein
MKQSTYLKAIKTLPDYFVEDQTRFAPVDEFKMVAANPQFAAMWYDGERKKPKWKIIDANSPFTFDGKELKVKE